MSVPGSVVVSTTVYDHGTGRLLNIGASSLVDVRRGSEFRFLLPSQGFLYHVHIIIHRISQLLNFAMFDLLSFQEPSSSPMDTISLLVHCNLLKSE